MQSSLFRCSVPEQSFDRNKLGFQAYSMQDVVEVRELTVDALYLTQMDVQLMNLIKCNLARLVPFAQRLFGLAKTLVVSAAGTGVLTGPPSANAEFPKSFEGRSGIRE